MIIPTSATGLDEAIRAGEVTIWRQWIVKMLRGDLTVGLNWWAVQESNLWPTD